MAKSARVYTLKIVRSDDGQLRIEIRALNGPRRYFKSLKELVAYLRADSDRRPRARSGSSE